MASQQAKDAEGPDVKLAAQVIRNVEAVLSLQASAEDNVGRHQKLIERVTRGIGRVKTVYLVLLIVTVWISFNSVAPLFMIRALDPPPFAWLQGVVGLSGLLIAVMILTTQNRQAAMAEKRDHLDLQVNLLAEQKVAKLVALIEELRRDLPYVQNRPDAMAQAMTQAISPHTVVSAIEGALDASGPVAVPETPPEGESDPK